MIEFFYKEEEKGPRRDTSQSLNTVFSTGFPVYSHAIQEVYSDPMEKKPFYT